MTDEATGSGSADPIKVFLVDDHGLFRAGVRAELDRGVPDVQVVGEAGSVDEAVAGIAHVAPDVVLLDVHMPDGGGAEVLRRVRPEQPDVVFLALSVSDAAEDVIAVIRAGARGYVTKTISGRELADAVRRVHGGDAVFSPRLAGFVLDVFSDRPGAAPPGDPEQISADRHGLADSVHARMTRHGGTVRLRSTPGEGTEVHLTMPIDVRADSAATRSAPAFPAGAAPKAPGQQEATT